MNHGVQRSKLSRDMIFAWYYPVSTSNTNYLNQLELRVDMTRLITDEAFLTPIANDLERIGSNRGFMYRYSAQPRRMGHRKSPWWSYASYGEQL